MFFSHIPTRTVGKQQDYSDQAHQEYDTQIEEADFKKLRTVQAVYDACTKK